jgi:excisionase family DNA binding protein
MPERLMTTREIASRLGFSPAHVRRLAREGELPVIRLTEHGHLRFEPEEVEALIERHRERRDDALRDALVA